MRALIFIALSLTLACDDPAYGRHNASDTAEPGQPGQPGDPNTPGTNPGDDTSDPAHNGGGLMPVAQSGSRLKRRVQVGNDGSEAFIGWWDDDLETECTYLTAVDGSSRCLPSGPDRVFLTDAGYFADSGCTQRALIRSLPDDTCPSTPTPRWFLSFDSCQRATVRQHMTVHHGPIYQLSSGSCVGAARFPETEYRSGGTSVPPTSFVQAQVQVR